MQQSRSMKRTAEAEYMSITDKAKEFLDAFMADNNKYILEFGMGGSTIYFSQRAKKLWSVDHSIPCYNRVRKTIKHDEYNSGAHLEVQRRPYASFSTNIRTASIDLVLVGGSDRVQCALNSIRCLKPGGILMLNNAERPRYKKVHETLNDWKYAHTKQAGWTTDWWEKPCT